MCIAMWISAWVCSTWPTAPTGPTAAWPAWKKTTPTCRCWPSPAVGPCSTWCGNTDANWPVLFCRPEKRLRPVQLNRPQFFMASEGAFGLHRQRHHWIAVHGVILFGCQRLVQVQAQRLGHAGTIGRIGGMTVADVAELDVFLRITHGPRGVFKQRQLLLWRHQVEQLAGLLEVVVVVLVEAPVLCLAFKPERRLGKLGLALPLLVAVGFIVRQAAGVSVGTTGAVAVVAEHGTARLVNRNLIVVDAHPVALCVGVVDETVLQHAVGADADARYQVGG